MDAKCCDRCGKFYREYADTEYGNSIIIVSHRTKDTYNEYIDTMDLCVECRDEVLEFLKRPTEKRD